MSVGPPLPENAVETCRMTLVGFMLPGGGSSYVFDVKGGGQTSELVGLLEMAKQDVIDQNNRRASGDA